MTCAVSYMYTAVYIAHLATRLVEGLYGSYAQTANGTAKILFTIINSYLSTRTDSP